MGPHLLLLDRLEVRTPVSKLFEDRFCVSVSCRVSGDDGAEVVAVVVVLGGGGGCYRK